VNAKWRAEISTRVSKNLNQKSFIKGCVISTDIISMLGRHRIDKID